MKKKLILTLLTAFICATTAIKATSLAMKNNIIEIETTGVNEGIKTNLENMIKSIKEQINMLNFSIENFKNSPLEQQINFVKYMYNQILEILNDDLLNNVENYNQNTYYILQKIKELFKNFKKDIIDPKDLKSTVNDKIKKFSELVEQISLDNHVQEENAPLANENKKNNKGDNIKTDVITSIYNDNDNDVSPASLLQSMNNETTIDNKIEEPKANKIEDKKIEELKINNVKNENKIEEPKANKIEDKIIPTKNIINYIKDVLNFNGKIETYVIDYLVFSHNNDVEKFYDEEYLKTKMNEILNIIKTFSNRILNPEKELSIIKKFLNIKEIQKIFSDTELIISNNIKKIKSNNLFNYEDSELLEQITKCIDNLKQYIYHEIRNLINENFIVDNDKDFENFKNNVNLFFRLKYEIHVSFINILTKLKKLEISEDEFIKRTNDFLNEKLLYFHNQEKSKELSNIDKRLLDINDFCKNNIKNSKKSFDSKGVKKISNDVKTISYLPKPFNVILTKPIKSIINWETVLAEKLCTYEF